MGSGNPVYALAVLGSDLYAGGAFGSAGGNNSAHFIAKWDGSSWSALGSGLNGGVNALSASGSEIYAAGNFNYIAKWDGNAWSALGSGVNNNVYALAASGSDVYAVGNFTTADGNAVNCIAKWDGSSWSPLGSGMEGGSVTYPYVDALAVSGSSLYVGGQFMTAGGKLSAYVARAIVNPPVLTIERDGYGGYFIHFTGDPSSAYKLQRAPTLDGPWTTSNPQTAPASGLLEFWDLFPPPGQGFYRSLGP